MEDLDLKLLAISLSEMSPLLEQFTDVGLPN